MPAPTRPARPWTAPVATTRAKPTAAPRPPQHPPRRDALPPPPRRVRNSPATACLAAVSRSVVLQRPALLRRRQRCAAARLGRRERTQSAQRLAAANSLPAEEDLEVQGEEADARPRSLPLVRLSGAGQAHGKQVRA